MVVEIENISHVYPQKEHSLSMGNLNFKVNQGDFLCIYGESGCGKSTLLNIMTGMLVPFSGHVYWDKIDAYQTLKKKERILYRNGILGYMMQGASLLKNLTVVENITLPIEVYGKKMDKDKLKILMMKLNIWQIRNLFSTQISGGEYRRVSLARTLISTPKLLVADEPTSNLDRQSAILVADMLNNYRDEGNSVVVATHDSIFDKYADGFLNL